MGCLSVRSLWGVYEVVEHEACEYKVGKDYGIEQAAVEDAQWKHQRKGEKPREKFGRWFYMEDDSGAIYMSMMGKY